MNHGTCYCIGILAIALTLSACSSIEPYKPDGVETATRRIIWANSWHITDDPPTPRIVLPNTLKDVRIVNSSGRDAFVDFMPCWELGRIAVGHLASFAPGEEPELPLIHGQSVLIRIAEPVFFTNGALVTFSHRMSDEEVRKYKPAITAEPRRLGFKFYLNEGFHQISSKDLAGDGCVTIEWNTNLTARQQNLGHGSPEAAPGAAPDKPSK